MEESCAARTDVEIMNEAVDDIEAVLADHYPTVWESFEIDAVGGIVVIDVGPVAERTSLLVDVKTALEAARFDVRYDPYGDTSVKVDVL